MASRSFEAAETGSLWAYRLVIAAFVLLPCCADPARAHQVDVFAQVENTTIRGEVHYRGRIPAQQVTVTAFDPAGEPIGKAETDKQGKFSLDAQFRCDHRLVVDTGEGHGAEVTVVAAQLPRSLPARSGGPGRQESRTPASPSGTAAGSHSHAPRRLQGSMIFCADIGELRKQLKNYEQRMRVNDVVGAIGYIVGVTGLAFYYLGARRQRSKSAG